MKVHLGDAFGCVKFAASIQSAPANVMQRGFKFWTVMILFQVAFGLVVFAATRSYYKHDHGAPTAAANPNRPPIFRWDQPAQPGQPAARPGSPPSAAESTRIAMISDPNELGRLASEYYTSQQYELAAEAYDRLLTFDPNVEVYNNLGITLFNAGRVGEALTALNEGAALDPSYQRIWLTLGFVNSRMGNVEAAREALTTAVGMGTDNNVGQSAQQMLDDLPPA